MPTPKRPRARPARKPAPDPQALLARLRPRLDRDRAALARWEQRLRRAFHAAEKLRRSVARLERRVATLTAS